jgi:hypothetical protein
MSSLSISQLRCGTRWHMIGFIEGQSPDSLFLACVYEEAEFNTVPSASSTPTCGPHLVDPRSVHAVEISAHSAQSRILNILARANKKLQLQFHRYCVYFPVYGLHPFEIYILHRLALLSTLLILGTAFWVFRLGSMLRWHCGTFIYKAHKVTNDRHILQDRESGMEDLNRGVGFCWQAVSSALNFDWD